MKVLIDEKSSRVRMKSRTRYLIAILLVDCSFALFQGKPWPWGRRSWWWQWWEKEERSNIRRNFVDHKWKKRASFLCFCSLPSKHTWRKQIYSVLLPNQKKMISLDGSGLVERYIKWAANLVESMKMGIPWVMCKKNNASGNLINACNGWHCGDTFPGPNRHDR